MQTHTTAASEKEKGKRKEKAQGKQKKSGRAFLGEEKKHKIQDCGQKRTLLGGPKDAKKKNQLSKSNDGSQKGSFRPYHPDKGAGMDHVQNKGKGYSPTQKKARKKLILNTDFQPLKHLKKKDIPTPGNLMTGLPVSGLTSLGLQLQDGTMREIIVHEWRYLH